MDLIRPRTAGQAHLSKSSLERGARSGKFDKIARGLYREADAPPTNWDWLEAASRRSEATICLTSALAHHELIDEIPTSLDIAIHRGARIPATEGDISWHTFAKETFELGRETLMIPGTRMSIGLYGPERSIVDAFRLRGELGYEMGIAALREWLRRGGKQASLADMATRLPRARKPLLDALAVLT